MNKGIIEEILDLSKVEKLKCFPFGNTLERFASFLVRDKADNRFVFKIALKSEYNDSLQSEFKNLISLNEWGVLPESIIIPKAHSNDTYRGYRFIKIDYIEGDRFFGKMDSDSDFTGKMACFSGIFRHAQEKSNMKCNSAPCSFLKENLNSINCDIQTLLDSIRTKYVGKRIDKNLVQLDKYNVEKLLKMTSKEEFITGFSHRDLQAEHILKIDENKIGLIDFEHAGITHPLYDYAHLVFEDEYFSFSQRLWIHENVRELCANYNEWMWKLMILLKGLRYLNHEVSEVEDPVRRENAYNVLNKILLDG